ncbi:hypothetical protein T459_14753 [Capsicum annuum]|uniref:Lysine-specific demethylase JMJD5 n=1 Tax=Capsicum annuum TaxID=4072 RepID=A0A2G2ZIA9_CAPAN|nr:hypothetical protein T459_14753 [Capsicum annuum]
MGAAVVVGGECLLAIAILHSDREKGEKDFHHSTSATSVIGKITREVASGVLRKHQKRWHGNRYIQVQQLLPRKSLSCKLVGKRPGLLLEAFPKDHYLSGSPMVIRDSMDQWPAKNKWNDMNYLRKVAGFRTVPIEPSRVGLNLCQDGAGCRESVLRCYRREVYSMSMERELPVTLGSSLEFTDERMHPERATTYSTHVLQVGLVSNYDLLALDSESGLHFEYSYLSSVAAPHYKED